jgi:serine/threonine-protein kinase
MTDQLDRLKKALSDRYTIEREIGSGGMATVYLAEDLKHHRKVAIKVLRPDLAATLGPERFLREIEVVAQLQHPHILPLHDSGETEGFLYYVMPYVEGQSLRDKLAKEGELPIGDAVRIIRDVVDALTEAHAHGVVHRDIKPENILLRGRHALVTDFGVAKAVSEATGREQLTTAGVALGTPAYMAPEQASADPHLDHRVDIYAVGAVVYELLTGRPVFMGTTPQMILSAHVTEVPQPVTKHRDTVPIALESLVMRCLEKKPADRWQSAEELLPRLETLATPSGGMTPTETRPVEFRAGRPRWLVPVAVTAVVLVVAALVLFPLLGRSPLTITASNIVQVTSDPGLEFQPAISPDGEEVAYIAGTIANPQLVVRSAVDVGGGGETMPATDAGAGHWLPAWTADGASIRYAACAVGGPCSVHEVGSRGGAARIVSLPRMPGRYAWSRDGTRVAFAVSDSIFAYSMDDPEPQLLGVHVVDPWLPHSLAWSPDGRLIAYVNGNPQWRIGVNVSAASIWILGANGGEPVRVTDDTTMNVSPQWLPDSRHLLFVSNRDGPRGIYVVEVGPDGPRGPSRSLLASSDPHSISVSADGRRLAYSKFTAAQNIWSVPIPRSGAVSIREAVPVTTGSQIIEDHGLSPDGEWIVYDGTRRGNADLYRLPLAGGDPRLIVDLPDDVFYPDWSPDGTEIAFGGNAVGGTGHVWVVSAEGGVPAQLTDFQGTFSQTPDWSPDGLRIAFMTQGPDATGAFETWLLARDRIGGTWSEPVQLTDFGCSWPAWAPDGGSLVCDAGADAFARVSGDGTVLLRYNFSTAGLVAQMVPEFSRDGSRIYFLAAGEDGSQGVWWVPAEGGDPSQAVAFDDPTLTLLPALSVGRETFYLTIAEWESDIWAMDLEW